MPDLPTIESLTIPAGPFLPVLKIPDAAVDVDTLDAAHALSDRIQSHAPQALPMIVLGDAELTMLDDDQLAQLGLVRLERIRAAARRDHRGGAHHDILMVAADALDLRLDQGSIGYAATLRQWLNRNPDADRPERHAATGVDEIPD